MNAALVAWYRGYLTEHPTARAVSAISAGFDAHGRFAGSPDIADHRAAYLKAKEDIENPS